MTNDDLAAEIEGRICEARRCFEGVADSLSLDDGEGARRYLEEMLRVLGVCDKVLPSWYEAFCQEIVDDGNPWL